MYSNYVKIMLLATSTKAQTLEQCSEGAGACTWEVCQRSADSPANRHCNQSYCEDNSPGSPQCYKPFKSGSDVAKCNAHIKDCNATICYNPDYKFTNYCGSWNRSAKDHCGKYGHVDKCLWETCQQDFASGSQFCSKSFCAKNPSAQPCLDPADVKKCQANSADCTSAVCGSAAMKDNKFCQLNNCKQGGQNCSYETCHSDEADLSNAAADCRAHSFKCNATICFNPLYKDYQTCSMTWLAEATYHCESKLSSTDGEYCTWDICQASEKAKETSYCKASYCDKHPSKSQCINPDDALQCSQDISHCTSDICKNSNYKDFDTCQLYKCKTNSADCTMNICKGAGASFNTCVEYKKDVQKKNAEKAAEVKKEAAEAQAKKEAAEAQAKKEATEAQAKKEATEAKKEAAEAKKEAAKAAVEQAATMKKAAATKAATFTTAQGKSLKEAEVELTKLQALEKTTASAVATTDRALVKAKCFTTGEAAADCIALAKTLENQQEDAAAYKEAIAAQERHVFLLKREGGGSTTIIIISVVASVLVLGGVGFYCHHKKKTTQQDGAQFTNDVYTAMVDGEQ